MWYVGSLGGQGLRISFSSNRHAECRAKVGAQGEGKADGGSRPSGRPRLVQQKVGELFTLRVANEGGQHL